VQTTEPNSSSHCPPSSRLLYFLWFNFFRVQILTITPKITLRMVISSKGEISSHYNSRNHKNNLLLQANFIATMSKAFREFPGEFLLFRFKEVRNELRYLFFEKNTKTKVS